MIARRPPKIDLRAAPLQRPPSAAQIAFIERRVLPISSLSHGAHYNGLLDEETTVGRWHSKKRRFIFWERNVSQPRATAIAHVADPGTGSRFAPLSRQESERETHVSDFAFETTGT
jgi:hypothetical protein